jgi:hypothetical protein
VNDPANPEQILAAIEADWGNIGACRSCGWHNAWFDVERSVRETLEDHPYQDIWLVCGSDDGSDHRGTTISVKDYLGTLLDDNDTDMTPHALFPALPGDGTGKVAAKLTDAEVVDQLGGHFKSEAEFLEAKRKEVAAKPEGAELTVTPARDYRRSDPVPIPDWNNGYGYVKPEYADLAGQVLDESAAPAPVDQPDELEQWWYELQEQMPQGIRVSSDWHTHTRYYLQAIHALIAREREAAQRDIDHVIEVMEAGKELSRRYEKYEGNMDWPEFVEATYLAALTKGETNGD